MKIINIIIAICSLLFIMIGVDKFISFLEPPCSLQDSISPTVWKTLGALQIVSGVLLWIPKYRQYVAGFFFVFMLIFTGVHLMNSTYDIGGSLFMAVMLGLLIWNPKFIHGKKNT